MLLFIGHPNLYVSECSLFQWKVMKDIINQLKMQDIFFAWALMGLIYCPENGSLRFLKRCVAEPHSLPGSLLSVRILDSYYSKMHVYVFLNSRISVREFWHGNSMDWEELGYDFLWVWSVKKEDFDFQWTQRSLRTKFSLKYRLAHNIANNQRVNVNFFHETQWISESVILWPSLYRLW